MAYKSGKWFHKEPEYNKMSDQEIMRHFEKEQKRYDNGYMGMDGDYYMYLTQFKLRHRASGLTAFPDDMEAYREIVFPWLKEVERTNADAMWITQRGAGKSTVMTGYLPMKTVIKFPGSKTIMTSESVDTTRGNFSEKLKVAYEGMHPLFRPSLIDGQFPNEKNDKQYVKFGVRGGRNKNDGGSGSIIQSVETAHTPKSPTKLEGQGAKTVIIDELFKHPYVEDVRSKGYPLVRQFSKKVGSIYYVGSLSDATAKGLKNAIDLWTNAKTHGIMPLFVDATWFNAEIDAYDNDGYRILNKSVNVQRKDGTIDRVKAREEFLKIRRILEKLPNKKPFMEFMLMYPLEINELLDVMTDTWLNDEDIVMCKDQKKIVETASTAFNYEKVDRPAILYPNSEGSVTVDYSIKRDHAKYFIYEMPHIDRHYGIGIDTIPGNSENINGSDHVAVVKCFETDQYVAYYAERSNDMMRIAKCTMNLQKLYNNAVALVERNSIGALKLAYEQEGTIKMLANCPRRFRPKGGQVERGLNKDKNTPELRQLLRSYVGNNIFKINLLRFFNEMLDFPFENTDLMDAMAMAEALHEDYRRLEKGKAKTAPVQMPVRYVTGADGVRRMVIGGGGNHISSDGSLDLSQFFGIPKKV